MTMKKTHHLIAIACVALSASGAYAQTTLHVYGPGGPAPAMKEAAAAFEKKTGTQVVVTAGPTGTWLDLRKKMPMSSTADQKL